MSFLTTVLLADARRVKKIGAGSSLRRTALTGYYSKSVVKKSKKKKKNGGPGGIDIGQ